MDNWYQIVTQGGLGKIPECIEFFEEEFLEARKEVREMGILERQASMLPGIIEYRFTQLQMIEAILEHLNKKYEKKKFEHFKNFFEGYSRALKYTEALYYAENHKDVSTLAEIVNQFALVRNKFNAILKGLDNKQFQISNIVKLRTAGMEDAEINYTPPKIFQD